MTTKIESFYSLSSAYSSLVIDCRSGTPVLLYFGKALEGTTAEMIALLATHEEPKACPTHQPPLSLSPEFSRGFLGNAGIQVHRQGQAWDFHTSLADVTHDVDRNALCFISRCQDAHIEVKHDLMLHSESGVLVASTELSNLGDDSLAVDQCNAPTIPIPGRFNKLLTFEGKWANEFQLKQVDRFSGVYLRENRTGRTSNDNFPGIVIHVEGTTENSGEAYGMHFGWSGNHQLRVEHQSFGSVYAQMGELFHPGELCLDPGESYRSPNLHLAYGDEGFSSLSNCFHKFVRRQLTDSRTLNKERPVHFNTWEAMYFDLSQERLFALADQAAAVGVERFVLDDGWFKGRDSDRSGLGDWYVDQRKFPNGLTPLIDHVHSKGMEFGLWIEPEMINPDSDLYRSHPNWVLRANSAPDLMARNQLVLDLSNPAVQDFVYHRIDELLSDNAISYLKWDMNRDLNQPGNFEGRAAAHKQTLAVYDLLKKVRTAHPQVEIESCSSGGARADYGILQFTDRIWTSDSNDAIDRLRIQKGFSYFFPAEIMGSHVGPATCHITGRKLSMEMRAGVALFGSFGIEANLLEMDEQEKGLLRNATSLYKKHRQLIHSGRLVRLDFPAYENGFGIISEDRTQALFSYALLDTHPNRSPGRYLFRGLRPTGEYEIEIIWPNLALTESHSILDVIQGVRFSGEALMRVGMRLPILLPASLLIMHLRLVQ